MEEARVVIEIPLKGDIRIRPVGKCEKLEGLEGLNKKLPTKNISAFEGIGLMRYEGST